MKQSTCEVCKGPCQILSNEFDGIHVKCERCGEYKMSGSTCATISELDSADVGKLSGWIYDQNAGDSPPLIMSDDLETILSRPIPSPTERMDRLLLEAVMGQYWMRFVGQYWTPLYKGEAPVTVDDEKSVGRTVDRAVERQRMRPRYRPPPDHPWNRMARIAVADAAARRDSAGR